jgi:hypothetical protein
MPHQSSFPFHPVRSRLTPPVGARVPTPGNPRGRCRARAVTVALIVAVLCASAAALFAAVPPVARAQTGDTVAVVVDFGDGRVVTGTVTLEGGETGLDVLARSGVTVTQADGFVCAIGAVGCPATDCMCGCPTGGAACRYWAYYHGTPGGDWASSEVGAGAYTVPAGGVEGWVWGGDRPPGAGASTGTASPGAADQAAATGTVANDGVPSATTGDTVTAEGVPPGGAPGGSGGDQGAAATGTGGYPIWIGVIATFAGAFIFMWMRRRR